MLTSSSLGRPNRVKSPSWQLCACYPDQAQMPQYPKGSNRLLGRIDLAVLRERRPDEGGRRCSSNKGVGCKREQLAVVRCSSICTAQYRIPKRLGVVERFLLSYGLFVTSIPIGWPAMRSRATARTSLSSQLGIWVGRHTCDVAHPTRKLSLFHNWSFCYSVRCKSQQSDYATKKLHLQALNSIS